MPTYFSEGNSTKESPSQLVEHFFRHETGRLHATLIRMVGIQRLHLAEDVAQEAMLKAMRMWSMGGVPANPAAWITKVAMNLARDALRREHMTFEKEPAVILHHEQTIPSPAVAWENVKEIRDDMLRLLFVCGHPEIASDAQVVLALKVICGFSTTEIARAFLSSVDAIEKQLSRTKKRIADAGINFEIPENADLAPRLNAVLGTLYLLFNEGYKASSGDKLLREDLCNEAIRLTALLVAHPVGNTPHSHALLALMLLNAARFPSRQDEDGALIRLEDQDRSRWNQEKINQGLFHLSRAAEGATLSEYHIQAGIAAVHCTAQDAASTNWARIVEHYDALLRIRPSPIVALNRAVALARAEGPQAALKELANLPDRKRLESNYLLHAVEGELKLRCRDASAATSLQTAFDLCSVEPEKDFIAAKIRQLAELKN